MNGHTGSVSSYCLVRLLDYMDLLGEQILNEYDCPLLSMTNLLYCIPSNSVIQAVSVVHECTSSCTFVQASTSRRVEHEVVDSTDILFKHDLSNKMYCYNVYCIDV